MVEAIRRDLGIDVAVVDDGSTDQTAEKAIAAGAAVITHPFNLGVGAAIRTGFRFAAAKGYDVVIQVDADGQHDTGSASRVLEPVLAGHADIVVGSRFAEGYALSGARAFGMRMLHEETNEEQGVREAMMSVGDSGSCIQLLAPLSPESTIAKFLDRSGPGIQQLAYRVEDIDAVCATLRERGLRLLYETPKRGTSDSRVNFIHPKDAGGILVELVEPAATPH